MSDFVNFCRKGACFGVLGSPSALIPITKNLYDDILILLAQNEIYVITNKMIPNTKNLSVYTVRSELVSARAIPFFQTAHSQVINGSRSSMGAKV